MIEPGSTMEEPATGKLFAQARNERGLSIQQVASELKLPKQTLRKLEALEDLKSADVYQRGYLKRYARLLGMDWEAGHQGDNEVIVPAVTDLLPRKKPRFPAWMASVFAVVVLVAGLWYRFSTPEQSPSKTSLSYSTSRQQLPTFTHKRQATEVVLRASMEQSSRKAEFVQSPSQTSIRNLSPIREAHADIQTESVREEPEQTAEHYLLQFSGESWVEVRDASGQRLAYRLFHAGESLPLKGKPPYDLLIGDHTQARLRMDGQAVDLSAFARGKVVRINTASLQGGRVNHETSSSDHQLDPQAVTDVTAP